MFPTFNQFSRWAAQVRVIPLWIEPELPGRDFLEWVHALAAAEQKFFFLHSASKETPDRRGDPARYSYIALDAPRYHVEAEGDTLTLRNRVANGAGASLPAGRQEVIKIGNPYER